MHVSEWPSFRDWQTTRLPEPYRTVCAARWAARDWAELAASLAAGMVEMANAIARALRPGFEAAAEGMRNMLDAFRPLLAAADQ